MKRAELEHILRAAGSIADDTEIVVVGSQASLARAAPGSPGAEGLAMGRARRAFGT